MTIRTLLEYEIKIKKYSGSVFSSIIDLEVNFSKNKDTWYRISKFNLNRSNTLGKFRLNVMNVYGSIGNVEIIK